MFLYKFGHVVFGEHHVSSSNSSLCFAFPLILPMQALLVVEARTDVDYLCCFIQGSVILCISLKKNVFFPGATSVFTTDIANRTCNYIRKVVFAVCCIVLYRGFSNSGGQYSLEDQNEVTRLECWPGTALFDNMGVTSALVLPKPLPVTNAVRWNNIMTFKYELVGTSNLPCAMSTIFGKVPIIIAAIPERLWSRASWFWMKIKVSLHRDIYENDLGAIGCKE